MFGTPSVVIYCKLHQCGEFQRSRIISAAVAAANTAPSRLAYANLGHRNVTFQISIFPGRRLEARAADDRPNARYQVLLSS